MLVKASPRQNLVRIAKLAVNPGAGFEHRARSRCVGLSMERIALVRDAWDGAWEGIARVRDSRDCAGENRAGS